MLLYFSYDNITVAVSPAVVVIPSLVVCMFADPALPPLANKTRRDEEAENQRRGPPAPPGVVSRRTLASNAPQTFACCAGCYSDDFDCIVVASCAPQIFLCLARRLLLNRPVGIAITRTAASVESRRMATLFR